MRFSKTLPVEPHPLTLVVRRSFAAACGGGKFSNGEVPLKRRSTSVRRTDSGGIGSAQRVVTRNGFTSVVLIENRIIGSNDDGDGDDDGESGNEVEEGWWDK